MSLGLSAADDQQPDRPAARDRSHRGDGPFERVEFQVDRQTRDRHDELLVRTETERCPHGRAVDPGVIRVHVDRWLQDGHRPMTGVPRTVGKSLGAHQQRDRPGHERRHGHRQDRAREPDATDQVGAEVGVEARRPLVAVDHVDALAAPTRPADARFVAGPAGTASPARR